MPTLAEIRNQYPQYQDLSDQQLADGLYRRFYSDMPRDVFNQRVGLAEGTPVTAQTTQAPAEPSSGAAQELTNVVAGGVNRAIPATLGAPVDLVNTALGLVGLNSETPVGGSRWIAGQMRSIGINPEANASSPVGRIAQRAVQEVTGAALTGGAARGLTAAAEAGRLSLSPTAQAVAESFHTGPAAQAAAAAGVGAGAGAAQEIAPNSPAAEMLGGLAAGAVGASGVGLMHSLANPGAAERLAAFQSLGVRPTPGAIAEGRIIPAIERVGADMVGGAPFRNAIAQSAEDAARAGESVAARFGQSTTPTEAGQALQRGAQQAVDTFQQQSGARYDTLGRYIPPDTVLDTAATREALRAPGAAFLQGPVKNAALGRELVPDMFRRLSDALNQTEGKLTYEQLRQLRTAIGQRLREPVVLADAPRAELERIYGAATTDLRNAAEQAGPEALSAFDDANQFYRQGRETIRNTLEPVLQATPDQAFSRIVNRPDVTTIANLRQAIPTENWGDFVSGLLTHMGRDPSIEGGWSTQRFMQNWSRFARNPQVQDALVGGSDFADASHALSQLVRVSQSLRSAGSLANTSGTSRGLYWQGALTGGLGMVSPTAAVGSVVSPWVVGKLMTSPGFIRMLASATKWTPAHSRVPEALARFSAQLADQKWSHPDEAAAARTYADHLQSQAAALRQRRSQPQE